MANPFLKDADAYKRDLNPVRDYVHDTARYLNIMTGRPLDDCRKFVVQQIKGPRALKVPMARYLERNKVGDREIKEIPFNHYLNRAIANNEIIAPTLTTYMPAARKESVLGKYIKNNVKRRSVAKKAMFQAERDQNETLKDMYSSQQTTFKIKNNALSGAHCSPFTPLWNKTAHSTLTSVCRVATSLANATNERFLAGNRHYYTSSIVETNIISIINHVDEEAVKALIDKYKLHIPSDDEIMDLITRSTSRYWDNVERLEKIRKLVSKLNDWQRCAYMYVGDLYHLAKYNDAFVRNFLTELSRKVDEPVADMEEAKRIVATMDDNISAFVAVVCQKELDYQSIKDVEKRPEDYRRIAANTLHRASLIESHGDFISTFWATANLPPSIYAVPSVIREVVLTSDTDSTIFTIQYWVQWLYGSLEFTDEAIVTANGMIYLVSQVVSNVLAVLSGNMGIEERFIFFLQMKNEFFFPIFSLTSRAKHYYAYRLIQEGLFKREMETEIKGVALRTSALAANVIKQSNQMARDIMDAVMRGEMISVTEKIRTIATIEREVLAAVESGSFDYFKKTRIQDKSAYKSENSNYLYYELWEAAFAHKYGHAPEPPYNAVAITLNTDKPAKFKQWIDTMEDRVVAEKVRAWAEKNNKLFIGTIYLPTINLISHGVPPEFTSVANVRRLLAQLMESFYLIMETLGVFAKNKKITKLFSDDQRIESIPGGVLHKKEVA